MYENPESGEGSSSPPLRGRKKDEAVNSISMATRVVCTPVRQGKPVS